MATLTEETLRNASYLEQIVIQEVLNRREEYLDNKIVKAEWVERTRSIR